MTPAERAAWEAGAAAMRDRIADGVRRWWERARGRGWPGHPHWLEARIRRLQPADADEKIAANPATEA